MFKKNKRTYTLMQKQKKTQKEKYRVKKLIVDKAIYSLLFKNC